MEGQQLYLSGFRNDPPKGPKRQRISLPLDMVILVSVVLVLLLILSFSLGVEKGKRTPSAISIIKETDIENSEILTDELAQEEAIEQGEEVSESQEVITEEKIEEKKDQIRYKIQVASFYKENTANRAADDLKEQGYPASVARKGKFAVVYVGDFYDEAKAKQILQSLRKQYKDCILRRL